MPEALDRVIGNYGMSIATSLAIEGASHTGDYSDREGRPPIHDFEQLWFNLRTLIRNAHNAFESTQHAMLNSHALIESVQTDWESIQDVMEQLNPQCDVGLYLCSYEGVNEAFPKANFRNNNTPKQLQYESLERDVISYFLENYKDELKIFKWKLKSDKGCVLVTHLPLDLVSMSDFPKLSLLESHTGVVKERRHWYTKMNIKRNGAVIPFSKMMLQIFGDGAMFAAQPIKIRRTLLKISEKRKWHPLTTESKILQDIKLEHEPHLLEFVNRYR